MYMLFILFISNKALFPVKVHIVLMFSRVQLNKEASLKYVLKVKTGYIKFVKVINIMVWFNMACVGNKYGWYRNGFETCWNANRRHRLIHSYSGEMYFAICLYTNWWWAYVSKWCNCTPHLTCKLRNWIKWQLAFYNPR